MTAQAGARVLIQVGDGGNPESFLTLGGLRLSHLDMHRQALNATNLESGVWRALQSGAIAGLTISGGGIFTDAASEEKLRAYAFAGTINNYRFLFASGDYIAGPFMITAYERSGSHDAEELYALTLESAGPIVYTAG